MASETAPIIIPTWAQGRAGIGQGGFVASKFQSAVNEPLSIALKRPAPLETPLVVIEEDDRWLLVDPSSEPAAESAAAHPEGEIIMIGTPRTESLTETSPVSLIEAAEGKARFAIKPEDHVAPLCKSCGTQQESMQVWPGPLDDGRLATDWTPPAWTDDGSGFVGEPFVWMALDCACGFYVGHYPEARDALTVQLEVEVLQPIKVGETYAIVSHNGRWHRGWDGRKRGAASCVFDYRGNVVARSDSFWLSVDN